jgi:glycine oxidase
MYHMRDYLIIGQGLAGTVVTHFLEERGMSLLVIDEPRLSASSRIAPAVWNPVIMKRFTTSWMGEELIAYSIPWYEKLEAKLKIPLLHRKTMVRLFHDETEAGLWKKASMGQLKGLIDEGTNRKLEGPFTPHAGYGTIINTGYLDLGRLLSYTRESLKAKSLIRETQFDVGSLMFEETCVVYKDEKFRQIIFCEGYLGMNNPLFPDLAWKPVKGEILTIYCAALPENVMINSRVHIVPVGNHVFRVGATFNWDDLEEGVTEEGRGKLEEGLKQVITAPYEIISQEAGVRPATAERRPFVLTHPQYKNVHMLNGFGTRGVILAPYFAKKLLDTITAGMAR